MLFEYEYQISLALVELKLKAQFNPNRRHYTSKYGIFNSKMSW